MFCFVRHFINFHVHVYRVIMLLNSRISMIENESMQKRATSSTKNKQKAGVSTQVMRLFLPGGVGDICLDRMDLP